MRQAEAETRAYMAELQRIKEEEAYQKKLLEAGKRAVVSECVRA